MQNILHVLCMHRVVGTGTSTQFTKFVLGTRYLMTASIYFMRVPAIRLIMNDQPKSIFVYQYIKFKLAKSSSLLHHRPQILDECSVDE